MTVGKGVSEGYLSREQLDTVAREGLGALPVDGRRVLVIIPDGTRTMPMPMMFELIERELGPRVAALDYLVALGTHTPMNDAQLSALVGRPVVERARRRAPHLQSPVGRPCHVRAARDDSRARHRRSHRRPPATGRAGRAQSSRDRVRPRPHLRPRVSARGRRLLRRHEVPVSRHRSARDHSLHALARSAHHLV